MKYRLSLLLILFSLANCTQNFISYVKTPNSDDRNSLAEYMLLSVGLIEPSNIDRTIPDINTNYTPGILQARDIKLAQNFNTLEISKYTPFSVYVNTKNYLVANPYYASEGIVYQAEESTPTQGKFVFISGEKSGQLKIRLYTPDGTLQSESTWYIEII